jgi:RND family efflux transporter MFP subunit
MRFPVYIAGLLSLLAAGVCVAQDVGAITRPSEDVTLSFVRPGRIVEMPVKEGDTVKAGQLVARQDDEAERIELEQLRQKAEDVVVIRAREAQKAQKEVEHSKLVEAFAKNAVSRWDMERAKLDVTIAEIQVEIAKFEQSQDRLKYEQRKADIERSKMVSPIDGKVEQIKVKLGESPDQNEDVMRIVKINPLWIEAPVPLPVARGLKVGDATTVKFLDGATAEAPAKVVHVSAVADAASDTLNVRVEIPNPAGRPAGEHVSVRFK